MHGVQQLGQLIETLPVLAGVLLALHDGFPQLLNVRHPNIVEHRLALQAVLWHCRRGKKISTFGTEATKVNRISQTCFKAQMWRDVLYICVQA